MMAREMVEQVFSQQTSNEVRATLAVAMALIELRQTIEDATAELLLALPPLDEQPTNGEG